MVAMAGTSPRRRSRLTIPVKLLATVMAFALVLLAFLGWYICLVFATLLFAGIFSFRAMARRDQRLQESEQRLRTLFEGIDDALFVHDTDGRILDCNPAACRRLGYTRDEFLALRTSHLDAPEFAEGFAQRCARQMTVSAYVCEGVHLAKDGKRIPV